MLSMACEVPRDELDFESDVDESSSVSGARERFIHVSGICSTQWIGGKKPGNARLGAWDGTESIDAKVDQRRATGRTQSRSWHK